MARRATGVHGDEWLIESQPSFDRPPDDALLQTAESTPSPSDKPTGRRSVRGVVAALIRQVEAQATRVSTSTNTDDEAAVVDDVDGTDATWADICDAQTQTTPPPSLSRSSSFTWLDVDAARMNEHTAAADSSASSTADDDSESLATDSRSATPDLRPQTFPPPNATVEPFDAAPPVPPPRRFAAAPQRTMPDKRQQDDFNESLKLLMQFSDGSCDLAISEAPSLSPTAAASRFTPDESRCNYVTATCRQPTDAENNSRKMEASIYDNVSNDICYRQKLAKQGKLRPTIDEWSSSQRHSEAVPVDGRADSESSLRRDLSVISGALADSESSPVSPDAKRLSTTHTTVIAIGGPPPPVGRAPARSPTTTDDDSSDDDGATQPRVCGADGRASWSATALGRASSTGDVADCSPTSTRASQGAANALSSAKVKAESDAVECCKWLRAAGFPQYSQMYEDQRFPIDVAAVRADHEFLDQDSLQALFRRLHRLNRCAIMRVDNVVMRRCLVCRKGEVRRATRPLQFDESDDEDDFALSQNWRYQRKSRTWSRIGDDYVAPNKANPFDAPTTSAAPPATRRGAGADCWQRYGHASTAPLHGRVEPRAPDADRPYRSFEAAVDEPLPPAPLLRRSQSERIKDRARAFIRRMDIRSSSRRRKPAPSASLQRQLNSGELVIGSPTLVSHHSASPAFASVRPVSPELRASPTRHRGGPKRRGRVFESQSPDDDDAYESQLVIDGNSNIDRVFLPKLPSPPPSGSLQRAGFRFSGSTIVPAASANSEASLESASLNRSADSRLQPSPRFARREAQRGGRQLRVRADVEVTRRAESSDTDSPRYDDVPERRDSGVGSSLSRSPSGPLSATATVNRWSGLQQRSTTGEHDVIDCLSLPQLTTLRKLALLKLTALMERYAASNRSAGGWHWGVQKLFKRIKPADPKNKDRLVFGVPLHVIAQRTGIPLPHCILNALQFLRCEAAECVGLFRKPGVRSRIQKLRSLCEASSDLSLLSSQQVYDVADLVKQYFRELPESLLTNKLSETFVEIFTSVPRDLRLDALRTAILLLPDENRETLQTLLYFLRDVSLSAAVNQMTAANLSVCFAPSVFHLSSRLTALSPTRRHRTVAAAGGVPTERELAESQAVQAAFAQMIADAHRLFVVPSTLRERCLFATDDAARLGPVPLSQLGYPGNHLTYLDDCVKTLLKEHRERWKGWVTEGSCDGVEITSRKVHDGLALKLWRCWAEADAPPDELLGRLLHERHVWDDDVLKWRQVARLGRSCDTCQYVVNDMPPHPTRDFCLVRLWRTDVGELRGGCALVETSVDLAECSLLGGVRAHCLAARYLLEPCGAGRSRITFVCRADTKGREKNWYSKVFGYSCARLVAKLRDSFRQQADGPETKV